MAKPRKTESAASVATLEPPEPHQPPALAAVDGRQEDVGQSRQAPDGTPPTQPVYAADPHEKITVSLSDERGGPKAHLLRSHRFRQMQIRFDGAQPGEAEQAMLKDAGWTDRTQKDGIFTKQINPDAKWQSVQQMEREFRDVANAMRQANGLGPVLEGLVA